MWDRNKKLMVITFLATLTVALGCGGGGGDQPASPAGVAPSSDAAQFETPEQVFAALVAAGKTKNWQAVATMLTPESQAKMAASLLGGAQAIALLDESKRNEFDEILDRYGFDLHADSGLAENATYGEAMVEMFKPVKDLPAFIGEMAAWAEKNGDAESHGGLAELREIGELLPDGNRATAVVQTDRGPLPIEFRKTSGRWLVHLRDDDEIQGSTGSADAGRIVIDTEGVVTGTMTMTVSGKESSFEFEHVVAYRFAYQLSGPPTRVSTWVLLTPDPINIEGLRAQLEENQGDLMEARPFFPKGPYVMMEVNEDCDLIQVSGYALETDVTKAGLAVSRAGVEQNLTVADGRLQGEVRLAKGKDDELSFECRIDVLDVR